MMKSVVLLTFFTIFSLIFNGNGNNTSFDATISQPDSEKLSVENLPNKDLLLTSAQNYISSCEQSISSSNIVNNCSKRPSNAKKSPFRYIKCKKVFDERLNPFEIFVIHTLSGELSYPKFLFFLKRIRI